MDNVNIEDFKELVLTWTYNTLNTKFPNYFKIYTYNNDGQRITQPNVYWARTQKYRPNHATECYLDVVNDYTSGHGSSSIPYVSNGKMYKDKTAFHIVDISFTVSSMKNPDLGLTDLSAQTLANSACNYLDSMLKLDETGYYFQDDNDIAKPVLICTKTSDVSPILSTNEYEDTRDRHIYQFSYSFRYDTKEPYEVSQAQSVHFTGIKDLDSVEIAQSFDVNLNNDTST